MIAIKFILIAGLIGLLVLFLANPRNLKVQAWKKIFGVLFVILAVFFVIFPDTSNRLAHVVGVSRGADLLLYMLTLSLIFVAFNMSLKNQHDQRRIVILARKIAILESTNNKRKMNSKD